MAERTTSMNGSDVSTNDEITLFYNNVAVFKAERGVTLGLLKLIYASDENNSGILLGVKPRVNNSVPCLVTFDSTSLNHHSYDLLVQESQPSEPSSVNRENCQASASSGNGGYYCNSSPLQQKHSQIATHQGQNATLQPSSTNQRILLNSKPEQSQLLHHPVDTEISITQNKKCAPTEPKKRLNAPLLNAEMPHATPDSSANHRSTCRLGTNVSSSGETVPVSTREDVRGTQTLFLPADEETQPEPDSNSLEEVHFDPGLFNFDIGTVSPLRTAKGLRWPCDRCGKDFCSTSHLKRHWIVHTDFKPYKCSICSKSFSFQWDLKKHSTKHTGNKRFKCPLCPKSFNSRKELKWHNWLHTGKKEHKCPVCQHEFSAPGNLKVHMRKHTGEKPYKCEYCPKSFHMQGHYQYHVRRHTGEKPYTCDICKKSFSYSNNLSEHRNMHTGLRPHSCPHCDKKFTHRSTLKQHVLMHEGQKPYKCHICNKSFVQSSNYRVHLNTHKEKKDRMQTCDLCGKKLVSRRGILSHRKKCVKRTLDRANENKDERTDGGKRGEHKCDTCHQVFKYPKCLQDHLLRKHCNKQEEKRNKTRYECSLCRHCRVFTQYSSFKSHMEKTHPGLQIAELPVDKESSIVLRPQGTVGPQTLLNAQSRDFQRKSPDRTKELPEAALAANLQGVSADQLGSSSEVSMQRTGSKIHVPSRVTVIYVPMHRLQPAKSLLPQVSPAPTSKVTSRIKQTSVVTAVQSVQQAQRKAAPQVQLISTTVPREPSRFVPISPRPAAPHRVASTSQSILPLQSLVQRPGRSHFNGLLTNESQSSQTNSVSSTECSSVASQNTTKHFAASAEILAYNKEETGSQAISALRRLSEKVGELEQTNLTLTTPERIEEQKKATPPHLSALEQLSKRIGDFQACSEPIVEVVCVSPSLSKTFLDPKTQIPLRYPCLNTRTDFLQQGLASERTGHAESSLGSVDASKT